MVNQIKKNSKDIQAFLNDIEKINLYRKPDLNADGSFQQCKEFFEFVESKRKVDLAELAKKYKLIGPLVTKVEGLVFGTNSSKSPKMATYYAYWEKEIYNTIVKMITNNLNKLNEMLVNPSEPLFQIETILAVPDIALHLSPNEMAKLFLQSVRDCIEGANYFTRWMNGSCKECPPVKAEGQDEAYVYTFYSDVASRPELRDLANQIQTNVQKTIANMKKHLLKFKKYKSLWKADKVCFIHSFVNLKS
jgi:dynein heavy chain